MKASSLFREIGINLRNICIRNEKTTNKGIAETILNNHRKREKCTKLNYFTYAVCMEKRVVEW